MIFKNRAQNNECSFGCVACSAVVLKTNVANIIVFNFCEQKFVQHGLITIAIDCDGLSLLILEEKWLKYGSGPKSALNCDSFWVHRIFNVCVWVFCAPNATILLVYIPAKTKWASSENMILLSTSASSVSPLPSVVQSYTQPYSFGRGIKLIICQIRHELSVTIHKISTSFKKKKR